ncbi:MAG TPA: hypothetical protein H9862_01740 [Candidatus Akkermansia intestinigallinarum]|uniref:Uncharacterized protein n=1 Tax=Candidatus Akkermansia intestinigallinarum TaxID=2838431 RepID=A0A9D1VA11_9BACT|nr:hypothetical protein [Candidatus Akkermansia intestinigallinarum]
MKRPPRDNEDELIGAYYNRACIGIFSAGAVALLVSWRLEVAEMAGSLIFVLLVLYRIIKPPLMRRFFPRTHEEKVSFWMLLICLIILYTVLILCARQRHDELEKRELQQHTRQQQTPYPPRTSPPSSPPTQPRQRRPEYPAPTEQNPGRQSLGRQSENDGRQSENNSRPRENNNSRPRTSGSVPRAA